MRGYRTAFLAIGIVFFATGLGFVISDSMRGAGIAFFPIGFVFIVLALTSGKSQAKSTTDGTPPPVDPAP